MFASKSSIEERALICSIELPLPTFLTRRHDKHTSSSLVPLQQLCAFFSQQQSSPPSTVSAAAAPNISHRLLYKPPEEYDVASAREPPDPGDPAMTKNTNLKCPAVAHPIIIYQVVSPIDFYLLQCVDITCACVEKQVVICCYSTVECDKSGGVIVLGTCVENQIVICCYSTVECDESGGVSVFRSRRCYSDGIKSSGIKSGGVMEFQHYKSGGVTELQLASGYAGDQIGNE